MISSMLFIFCKLGLNIIYISVKVCKPQLSIQPANSKLQKPSDLSCLLSYIKSGRTLRNEHSIMYNTSHKSKDVTMSAVKEMTFRNLSSIRQHLFSRDSFAIHTNIDISEESIDVTGNIFTKASLGMSFAYIKNLFQLFWKILLRYLHLQIQ